MRYGQKNTGALGMQLSGHGKQKYVTGRLLATSADHEWSSILVELWSKSAGLLKPVRPLDTEIAIQLKGNSRIKRHGDGRVQDKHSIPGTIWLSPAGIFERSIQYFAEINECLHIYLPASLLSHAALEEFDIDPCNVELRYEGGFSDPFIEQIALNIRAELADPSPVGALLVESMRVALAAHLLKLYSNLPTARCSIPDRVDGLDARRMRRVLEFIDHNLHRSIALAEMAEVACFSPFHFARMFKKSTGQTPHHFVRLKRLDAARSLLSDTDASLSIIAASTGFSSQAHFSRCFSQTFGLPPGAYRQKRTS